MGGAVSGLMRSPSRKLLLRKVGLHFSWYCLGTTLATPGVLFFVTRLCAMNRNPLLTSSTQSFILALLPLRLCLEDLFINFRVGDKEESTIL